MPVVSLVTLVSVVPIVPVVSGVHSACSACGVPSWPEEQRLRELRSLLKCSLLVDRRRPFYHRHILYACPAYHVKRMRLINNQLLRYYVWV